MTMIVVELRSEQSAKLAYSGELGRAAQRLNVSKERLIKLLLAKVQTVTCQNSGQVYGLSCHVARPGGK